MTPEILPSEDEISLHVKLEIHKKGGHVGFINGSLFRPKYYLESRLLNFFNTYK